MASQFHTNTNTHPKCNPEPYTYTYADTNIYTSAYAYAVTDCHHNSCTKTYPEPKTSARATPSTNTTPLRRKQS